MTTSKWIAALAIAAGCGGRPAPKIEPAPVPKVEPAPVDSAAVYGPLDIGADWQAYTKVNREPVSSRTHGGRLVDTWVNDAGLVAYKSEDAPVPVGTVIVKTSRETTGEDGPIFVMAKREAGFSPEHDDWYFAIHWAAPPERWKPKVGGGPVYWRTPSPKADYCWECHENLDRYLGGVPAAQRAY
jgi:hypothetical protein